jgi:O-antigen ligase
MIMTKRGYIFKGLGLAAHLYIILFVAIMYCGANFFGQYIMPLVCVLMLILFGMAKVKGIQKVAFTNHQDRCVKSILLLITVFLIYQLTYSYNKSITLVFVERFVVFFLLFIWVPETNICFRTIKAIKLYSFPVAISIIVSTLLNGTRSGGLVGTYQYAGMMMSISFGVILIDYYYEHNKMNLVGLVLTLLALFMSGKRTFSFLVIISYFLLFAFNNAPKKRKRFLILSLALIITVIISYTIIPEVRELANRIILYSDDQTYNGRSYYWTAALKIFVNNKVKGIGMGCFSKYFDSYFHRLGNLEAFDAHNIYIQMLAEGGIIGGILFLALFATSLIGSVKLIKNKTVRDNAECMHILSYSLFIQIWFIVYGTTGNPLYSAGQNFFYISAIAMMMSVNHYVRYNRNMEVQT